MTWLDLITRDAGEILRCPKCHAAALRIDDGFLACPACSSHYLLDPDRMTAALLPESGAAEKKDISAWWGDLYEQWYAPTDRTLTADALAGMLDQTEDMFRKRGHLAATEMMSTDPNGKRILEIGSGGGAHSCLFKRRGASVVAVDITPQRAASTALKLLLTAGGEGRSYNADAENLPFRDDSFDIVYSNGVLHHSEDTDRAIREVWRVLKPGGKAVMMLYARHSAMFWCNIVPRALLSGEIFRWPEAVWIGRVTEGRPKFGTTRNPFTRVYSERQLRHLLALFRIISLRKASFQFDNFAVPKLSRVRKLVLDVMGHPPHPGGILVYGDAFTPDTPFEIFLGGLIGFDWNIVAEKPA